MNREHSLLSTVILGALLLSGDVSAVPAQPVTFESAVLPIFEASCIRCHGEEKREANLDLRSLSAMLRGGDSGPSLKEGAPDESLLLELIEAGEMPPKKPYLTKEEISIIRTWLERGAPSSGMAGDDEWQMRLDEGKSYWAFQPPQRPSVPDSLPPVVPLQEVAAIPPNHASIQSHLQAWYRAETIVAENDERVAQWKDDSGQGRHLRPTWSRVDANVGAPPRLMKRSPLGGRPAVRFDDIAGLASPAENPVPIHGDAAWTITATVSMRPPGPNSHTSVLVGFGDPAPGHNPGRPLASLLEIRRDAAWFSHSGGFGHDARLQPESMWRWYDRPAVITIVKRPGPMTSTSSIFLNGRQVPPSSLVGVDTTPAIHHRSDMGIYLGRAHGSLGAFRGEIGEVAIYDTALLPDQRKAVESGLLQKFGITIPGEWETAPDRELEESYSTLQYQPALHPIDAFVRARLEKQGLSSAPLSDRRTLIRRAYFDLIGLPPSPDEVNRFVTDSAPGAWERVIDRLLNSPHYGERWGRHWLDVARYADTGGYETDVYYRNAWRYRDYVVASLNKDKPYDRFLQEQIAGDEIWPDNLDLEGGYVMDPEKLRHFEALTATGLYALGPEIHESNLDAKRRNYERLTDWADTTASAFMGLTFACARCHDHKFDPISQRDYYALQAIFAGSREVEVPMQHGMGLADWNQHYPKVIAVEEARRTYEHFAQQTSGRARTPEEEQKLAALKIAIADRLLALPKTDAQRQAYAGIYERPTVTVLGMHRRELVPDVHFLTRGELSRPKQKVSPALPALLAEMTGAGQELAPGPAGTRRELALWLSRPEHPLTARLMVNRIWQWHFGRGIVATPSDFGKMGLPPSHPELLDWLATEFVARGWSLKSMHRLIMTSRTYRQSSAFYTERHEIKDPDNTLLWRMNRRRLEGETIWDAIHSVAGTLNLAMGGRPVMPPLLAEELTNKSNWVPSEIPSDHTRRGLYIMVRRNFKFPLFDLFDAPVNAVSCSGRNVSTVAPQALWLLNNQLAFSQAQNLAARLVREAGPEPTAQLQRAFELTLGRPASNDEVTEGLNLLQRLQEVDSDSPPLKQLPKELAQIDPPRAAALTKFGLMMLNLNEFLYVD